MDTTQTDELATPEDECEALAKSPDEAAPDVPELDEAAVAALDADDDPQADLLAGGLGSRGGGWGGAQHPVDRAQAIGRRNGLQVTSRKRSTGSSGSDHHTSQVHSDAVDLSNGTRPTPEMDRTARQIAALLGRANWQGGVLNWRGNGYRVQLLYKTNVGGNHYNHVHVGVRVGG
jgi:hypothetical protein